ncbi:MAG: TetR/AcrR family transcriptional regulator, partial [Actinomycetes bacterium]
MARPRKFDEQTVVRAARDQFWRTGYTATSLDDLMAATGLGRASIYAAFGDKHALFVR